LRVRIAHSRQTRDKASRFYSLVTMTCPSCGSDVPAGARFCPTCGHQVDLRGDERRVVTVLFADLARFTGLSESLDPESVKLLVDRCFAALAQDVTSHGGLVDKVVGDAIVALFGAPVAHEDDAERAVRSGLQMQRTIASLAVELDTPLQLRIGINTGEVLVGALRAGGDYTAMGDVVNVASRLQTAAQPGMVVVGAATRSATVDTVVYRELGQLVPRGREESVEVWEAVECLAPPGRRPRRAIAPLIGRESELELLRRSVAGSVTRRRPNLIVVVGDAGVGKSRLTLELSNWAAGSLDALVLEGRALPYGEANPWWPMAEVVQQACGITGSDTAEVARSHVAETVAGLLSARPGDPNVILVTAGLLHLMGHQDALRDVDPQRARQQARNALRTLILGLARRRPLILLLSEMHWADDLVLDLVGDGLDRFTGLPVTIALTARPELLERWSVPTGRYNVAVLHLDPLDDDASRRLVEALIEGAAPPGLVETLAARSGGNPFFVEELVSLTAHETEGGRGVELPATLRGIVGARFDSLSAEERSVLEDAAVIGRSGFVYTLRSMARTHGTADPDRVISQLVAQDLVAVTDGRWQFRSEVVREVVYDIITKTERARRHWELAEWIAAEVRRMRREDEFLEPLAHHYATAAELVAEIGPVTGVPATATAEAVAALTRAAHWSSDRELLLPAARLFDRALALLSDAGVNARRALLLDRALVRTTLRQLPGARADLDEAAEGAEGADRARALTVQGYVEQTESDWDRSMATLTRAVEEWRLIGDRDGEGDALRRAGMTSLFAGNVARAQELLDSALELARVDGHRRDEAWTLWHLAWASFASGATAEAESRLADAEEAFRSAGDTGGLGWVSGLLGWLRMVQGRRSEAEQLATGVLEDARERGDRWAVGMLLVLLGLLRLWDGRGVRRPGDGQGRSGHLLRAQRRSRSAARPRSAGPGPRRRRPARGGAQGGRRGGVDAERRP
jgi:class 3 adenylate cyclase/tetratricopeptide (TPR) repeat protein